MRVDTMVIYTLVYATDIYYTLFKDDPMNVENELDTEILF